MNTGYVKRHHLRFVSQIISVLVLSAMAHSQIGFSAMAKCTSEQRHKIGIGDSLEHAYILGQSRCVWITPITITHSNATEYVVTGFSEISGNSARSQSFAVGSLENGDHFHVHCRGHDVFQGGAFQGASGRWRLVGGTGSLRGISGQGTYTVTPDAVLKMTGKYYLPGHAR